MDDFEPYIESDSSYMYLLLSKDRLEKDKNEYLETNVGFGDPTFTIAIDTDKPYEVDEKMEKLKDNKDYTYIDARNTYEYTSSKKEEELGRRAIIQIPLYAIVFIIALFSALNIFNTVSASIALRKKEIAILKSMGMSKKQINKMLSYEGIFYGFDSLLYGIIFSLIILYAMYLLLQNTEIYAFQIPWINIMICIAITYLVIFIAMNNAKKKIKRQNIIDEIRDENV